MGKLHTLENDRIRIRVDAHGAELVSVVNKDTGREYMWSADEKYWNRVSPILFPVVGKYKDGKTVFEGQEYHSGQHGFARDMDFVLASQMEDELWFVLSDNTETKKVYPFRFSLMIGYRINGSNVRVMWNVMNNDRRNIFFSIGGHPAFLSPVEGASIAFDVHGPLTAGVLDENGNLSDRTKTFQLDGGRLALSHELFDEDALIFEQQDIKKAVLLDEEQKAVLAMLFDAPLLGIWSPAGKKAPFVCIEPWYGRTDRSGFDGDLTEREYSNMLKPSEVFTAHYDLIVY